MATHRGGGRGCGGVDLADHRIPLLPKPACTAGRCSPQSPQPSRCCQRKRPTTSPSGSTSSSPRSHGSSSKPKRSSARCSAFARSQRRRAGATPTAPRARHQMDRRSPLPTATGICPNPRCTDSPSPSAAQTGIEALAWLTDIAALSPKTRPPSCGGQLTPCSTPTVRAELEPGGRGRVVNAALRDQL